MNRIGGWMKRHWLGLAIAGGAVLVVGAAGWLGYRDSQARQRAAVPTPPTVAVGRGEVVLSVTAPGRSVSTRSQVLAAGVEGSVEEILVRPGDRAAKGQALARLGDRAGFVAALNAAQLQVLQAQKVLDDLRAGAPQAAADARLALVQAQKDLDAARRRRAALNYPRASDERLQGLEADYQQSLLDLAAAQENYDRVSGRAADDPERIAAQRRLTAAQQAKDSALATVNFVKGKPGPADIAEAEARLAQAQARANQAQRAWDAVKDGPEPTGLGLAQATLAQAQGALEKARADLSRLEIRAPFAGIVLAVAVQAGQTVTPGMALITLVDPYEMQVRATVVEEDLPLIAPGQAANLYFDALPDANLTGRLDRVIPQRDSDTQAIYPVYITLDELPEHLAAGMTVDASIVIARKTDVLRLPRAVVHAHSNGTADVQVWQNGRAEHRSIRVGLRGDSFVEVTGGLGEGDPVVAQ